MKETGNLRISCCCSCPGVPLRGGRLEEKALAVRERPRPVDGPKNTGKKQKKKKGTNAKRASRIATANKSIFTF